jgi:hypothetical protein
VISTTGVWATFDMNLRSSRDNATEGQAGMRKRTKMAVNRNESMSTDDSLVWQKDFKRMFVKIWKNHGLYIFACDGNYVISKVISQV